jgi:ketosteroid isomerase-like protein
MSDVRAVFEKMLAAWNAKDMDAIAAIMHPNLIYRVSGGSVISGEYRGVEGWREMSNRSIEETGGTRQYETKAVMYGDTHVAMLSQATGERRGKELNVDVIILFTVSWMAS